MKISFFRGFSLFCKTSCSDPSLKGYSIYFSRSLTGIHCVLTIYLTDSFASDVLPSFLFCQVYFVFYNANCSQLSNQANCDCFKSTEKVMFLLKETNCSSAFSMVPVYFAKLSALSRVPCSMHKSTCSRKFFHGECISLKNIVSAIHCLAHISRYFPYRYTNEIQNWNIVLL